MIITQILGNIADLPTGARPERIDYVLFDDETRLKRIQRISTDSGEEHALRLGPELRELIDGDILAIEEDRLIVARIAPTDVLVIEPASIVEALQVAHSLGNRHLPAQFFGTDSAFSAEVMVVRYDHTVVHYLEHAGVRYYRSECVMPEAFRHAEHSH